MTIKELSTLEMSDITYDADRLPVEWPLIHAGETVVTRSSAMPVVLALEMADLESIVAYQQEKRAKIPLDCNHVVSNLAGKIGMDESELLKQLPRYAGVAGFGSLKLKGDALYMSDVEYLPIGREVMKAKQFRYFSPTLRGLDGKSPLRISSVALTNNPHLQGVCELSAADTDEDDDEVSAEKVSEAIKKLTEKQEKKMADETTNPAVANAAEEQTKILNLLREVLGDDVTVENLRAKLAALKTGADSSDELKKKVAALECAEEARNLSAVRQEAMRRGKLTTAMLERDYFKKMSAAELSDYCSNVADGCAVPLKTLEMGEFHAAPPLPAKPFASVSEAIEFANTNAQNM